MRYNTQIIGVSLAMDVLIIGTPPSCILFLLIAYKNAAMMSLRNDFVYMQFHPVAYLVKLNIEMSMSNLIIKVARDTGESHSWTCSTVPSYSPSGIYVQEDSTEHSKSASQATRYGTATVELQVQVARQQFTVHDDIGML